MKQSKCSMQKKMESLSTKSEATTEDISVKLTELKDVTDAGKVLDDLKKLGFNTIEYGDYASKDKAYAVLKHPNGMYAELDYTWVQDSSGRDSYSPGEVVAYDYFKDKDEYEEIHGYSPNESKKSEDTYDRPVTLYASTRYDDAEEAQKFLDSISGGEVKVSKERNGDTLSVSIEGDDDAIDTFLAVYKDNYDTLEKDCDADVNGWTDPVDLKYYTVQGRKELTGESESKQNEKSKAVCAVCGEPTDDPVFDYDHTFCKDCYGDGGDVWKGDKANANAKFVVGTMISLDGVKQYIREFRPRTFVAQSVDTGKEVTLPRSSLNRAFALYDPRKSDYDDRGNLKNRESNKKGESKKSEGVSGTIKMNIDYTTFMRLLDAAAFLDADEDYKDALWDYYSELGEIGGEAYVFFDNLFQYTDWYDVDEMYDNIGERFQDESKSKEECIQDAIDDGDMSIYQYKDHYLVLQ